jgi:hypothetical protein
VEVKDTQAMKDYAAELHAAQADLAKAVAEMELLQKEAQSSGDPLFYLKEGKDRWGHASALASNAAQRLSDDDRRQKVLWAAVAEVLDPTGGGKTTKA